MIDIYTVCARIRIRLYLYIDSVAHNALAKCDDENDDDDGCDGDVAVGAMAARAAAASGTGGVSRHSEQYIFYGDDATR